jgi:long-chain acyl-CoA synthetase
MNKPVLKAEYPDINTYDTFPKLLAYNAAQWPDEVAMREKEFGIWNEFTWSDYNTTVKHMALGMYAMGIRRGEVVGINGCRRRLPPMPWEP